MENQNNAFGQSAFASASGSTAPIDGEVRVDISEDRHSVYITISGPIHGGKEVTFEQVKDEIEVKGITAPTDDVLIKNLIAGKSYNQMTKIASAVPPVHGRDGEITYRFSRSVVLTPKESENGVVDYKDLGLVHNIIAGTIIADIVHETAGTDGCDVTGTVIKALPGKRAKYALGKGIYFNDDETQMIAEVDGNLRWTSDRFTIESTLVIKEDVGVSTGNIDFIGDVLIKGNVHENFTVISKKNVQILGSTHNATIIAEGNVEIKTGCIYSDVSAKGSVKIAFCENSKIFCGGDLTSASFISCDIFCEGVLHANTGKGIIIGGKVTCLMGINANTVGSESYTKTRLTLGNGAILSEEKLNLEKEESELNEQITKLLQVTNILNDNKKKAGGLSPDREDMLSSAIRTRFKYLNDIKHIKKRIAEIDASMLNNRDLHIEVRKDVFPGVRVRIGTEKLNIEQKYTYCRIVLGDSGEIEFKPILS